MHERNIRSCFLGCPSCADNINHYIQRSPLWQIACSAIEVEDPFSFGERLCIQSPTPGRAKLRALAFCIYPLSPSEARTSTGGVVPSQNAAQQSAVEAARAFRSHVM